MADHKEDHNTHHSHNSPLGGTFTEIGKTGLRNFGGRINEEFLKELRNPRSRIAVFTEMVDNEPLISGTYFAIKQLIKRANWFVKPGGTKLKDKSAAKFLESCMHDMNVSWEDTLDEILSFIPYGYSVHEIVYKRRQGPFNLDSTFRSQHTDGRIGWRKLPIRAQETIDKWIFTEDGGIAGVIQTPPHGTARIGIPIQKLLLFRTVNYKNNPEGRSIFRASYVPYYYKKKIQNIEAIGIERELGGLPHATVPGKIMGPNASAEEKAVYEDFKNLILNVRVDDQAGVITPSDTDEKGKLLYDFKLISTNGRRALDTEEVLSRLNREILITVMADFLLLGHESVGSFALSSDKTRLFSTAVAGFMSQVKSIFNRHAVPRLFELNNIRVDNLPTIEHSDIETEPIGDIAQAIKFLAEAGVDFSDQDMADELFRRAGLKTTTKIIKPVEKKPEKPAAKKPGK